MCIEESGPLAGELQAAGVEVDVVRAPGLATNLRAPALIAWMARRGPHVVHTHSGAWLKGARAARAASVPAVVHTVHGLLEDEPWYSDFLKRRAAAATSAVVAVSDALHSHLLRLHAPFAVRGPHDTERHRHPSVLARAARLARAGCCPAATVASSSAASLASSP